MDPHDTTDAAARNTAALRTILKSQYHAALAMLRDAVEKVPDALWLADGHTNAPWQVAYHALFVVHFYMERDERSFRPWAGHQGRVQHPDGICGPPERDTSLPVLPRPYTKTEVLAYWQVCDGMVDAAVDALDVWSEESGFPWYPVPKLEHQVVNLRHVQHHAAQLADRVRAAADVGVRWVGARRPAAPGASG